MEVAAGFDQRNQYIAGGQINADSISLSTAESVRALAELVGRVGWVPGDPPRAWHVPRAPARCFSARADVLTRLRTVLMPGQRAVCVLAGLGGVGKTELALEFAQRYRADYEAVWWVRAELDDTLRSDLASLGVELQVAEADNTDQEKVESVKRWVAEHPRTLFILDNLADSRSVDRYVPAVDGVHCLITSRDPNWGAIAQVLQVDVWSLEEAAEFICTRTGLQEAGAASALAQTLGGLPLALEHACAYIERTRISIAAYSRLFQDHQERALAWLPPHTNYPRSVAATWDMAFQQLRASAAASVDLLNIGAFLAPDSIPFWLIRDGATAMEQSSELTEAARDDWLWPEVLGALRQYSLIDLGEDSFSVHRVVQMVMRDRLADARGPWATAALKVTLAAFKSEVGQEYGRKEGALSHAFAALDHTEAIEPAREQRAILMSEVGVCLRGRGDLEQARFILETASRIWEHSPDGRPAELARCLNDLGLVLQDQGQIAAARPLLERALDMRQQVQPSDPGDIAESLNNIGLLCRLEENRLAARDYLERAVTVMETAAGPSSDLTATILNNLGGLYQEEGDLASAGSFMTRAMAALETTFGHRHPDVATVLNNLGVLRYEEGDLAEAAVLLDDARGMREELLGTNHTATAQTFFNLGAVSLYTGNVSNACSYYEQALRIRARLLGVDHHDSVATLCALAVALQHAGDIGASVPCLERALGVCQRGGYRQLEAQIFLQFATIAGTLGHAESAEGFASLGTQMLNALRGTTVIRQPQNLSDTCDRARSNPVIARLALESYMRDGGKALIDQAFSMYCRTDG